MLHHVLMHEIAALAHENEALRRQRDAYATGSFGLLAPGATRDYLSGLGRPVDVIGLDIRKMHQLNEVIGFDQTTTLVHELLAGRPRPAPPADWAGQWGGDEFVLVTAAGDGPGRLARLMRQAAELNAGLTDEQRAKMHRFTAGLVNGLAVAAVLVTAGTVLPPRPPVNDGPPLLPLPPALAAASWAVEQAGRLKSGGLATGERATSGARGNVLAWARA